MDGDTLRPLDSKGRAMVMAYDVPVKCGDVLVKTGDIIFADFDGIVVVPEELSEDVFRRAVGKINSEKLSRKELIEGRALRDVYEKYHAL
jgi:4-hydroxy-4-methyl-2-oxoglutarate aldolase